MLSNFLKLHMQLRGGRRSNQNRQNRLDRGTVWNIFWCVYFTMITEIHVIPNISSTVDAQCRWIFSQIPRKVHDQQPIRALLVLWTNQSTAKYFCWPIRFEYWCGQAQQSSFHFRRPVLFSQQWRLLEQEAKDGIFLMIHWPSLHQDEMESVLRRKKVIANRPPTSFRTWDSVYKCKSPSNLWVSQKIWPTFLISGLNYVSTQP